MTTLSKLLTEKTMLGFTDMSVECGNGVLDNNEECDDGNFDAKDGYLGCKIDTFYECMWVWRHPTTPYVLVFLVKTDMNLPKCLVMDSIS